MESELNNTVNNGEGKGRKDFAEWHNYAECTIQRMENGAKK